MEVGRANIECNVQSHQAHITKARIPNGRSQTSGLFTVVAQDLYSRLPRTSPVSGQGGT